VSADRRNGQKPLGKLPPGAQIAVGVAWLEVLAARDRDVRWILVPRERGQRNAATTTGKIVGTVATPEDADALLNRNSPSGPDHHGVEGGG